MQPSPQKEPSDIGDYYSLVNTVIIVINIIIFLLTDFAHTAEGAEWLLQCGALYWPYVLEKGEFYRLLTSMFLHFGISHLVNNIVVLWIIGGTLEKQIGRIKYIFLYFLSGILAGIVSIGYNMLSGYTPICAGASGAIFGAVGAMLYIVLINRGKAPGLSRKQMLVFVFLSLYNGFANQGIDNAAHVGGFISGILLAAILYRRPKYTSTKEEWRVSSYDEN